MSGGHFDYLQYQIQEAADRVDDLIERFDAEEVECSKEQAAEIRARYALTRGRLLEASRMLHRIDYFVSGDDSLESFLRRWAAEGLPIPTVTSDCSKEFDDA